MCRKLLRYMHDKNICKVIFRGIVVPETICNTSTLGFVAFVTVIPTPYIQLCTIHLHVSLYLWEGVYREAITYKSHPMYNTVYE